jgi:hypothetical protein
MNSFNINIILFVVALSQVSCKFNIKNLFHKYHDENANANTNTKMTPHKLTFSFQNCGPSSDIFIVDSLMVTPDPIKLPGNLNLNGEVNIKSNITGPLQVSLKTIKCLNLII